MHKIWSVENSLFLFAKWPHTKLLIQVLREWNWHILHLQDFNDAQSFHFLLRSDNGKHGLLMYNIKSNKEASCSFPGEPCNSSLHTDFLRKKCGVIALYLGEYNTLDSFSCLYIYILRTQKKLQTKQV